MADIPCSWDASGGTEADESGLEGLGRVPRAVGAEVVSGDAAPGGANAVEAHCLVA